MNTNNTIQDAMSALLLALGFDAMAEGVKTEQDTERLTKYAKVILKQSPASMRDSLFTQFRAAGLV